MPDHPARAVGSALRAPLPLILRQLDPGLRAGAAHLAEGDDALVQVAVQDLAHAARGPVVDRYRLALHAQPLYLALAEALGPGDAFGVELPRDAGVAATVGRHAEDPAHDLGLLLVDDQPRGALHAWQALVLVAVHSAADHIAALEPGLRRVADARGRLLPLGLIAPGLQRGQQLRGVVRQRYATPIARRPDLDASLLDVTDQHHRVDLVTAEARLLDHDELRERQG